MARMLRCSDFDFASVVQRGDQVAWPQGTGEPTGLTARLMEQAAEIPRVTLVLGMVTSATLEHPNAVRFDYLCLNGAANTRIAVARSGNRVIPAHVSAIPSLINSKKLRIDVALVRVRPTADANVFSLGVMADFVQEMIGAARVVVAELDESMPLTRGDALVTREQVTHFVMTDRAGPTISDAVPNSTDLQVAGRVAEIIPDRATVQFGVGGIPVAVCSALLQHKDLGLHSGVIPDAVVRLIEAGVITNRCKGIDDGTSVTGGLFGTTTLFRHAHENRELILRRAAYTHAASTMAQIRAFHTINSAIAVDLTGQVNSETAVGRYVGAVGGQVDFVRGARLSDGGRSIIALASTTPDGRHSKIVGSLNGQPVTTARSDIDLVVTEFGVADLWGCDLAGRANALIAIAHPRFRDDLHRQLAAA
jgi:acyl-CoA hydrolase